MKLVAKSRGIATSLGTTELRASPTFASSSPATSTPYPLPLTARELARTTPVLYIMCTGI